MNTGPAPMKSEHHVLQDWSWQRLFKRHAECIDQLVQLNTLLTRIHLFPSFSDDIEELRQDFLYRYDRDTKVLAFELEIIDGEINRRAKLVGNLR